MMMMNYKRMWDILKAESGYRTTFNLAQHECSTILELMDRIEERIKLEPEG